MRALLGVVVACVLLASPAPAEDGRGRDGDPIVATRVSGVAAELDADRRAHVVWTTTPRIEEFETSLGAFTPPIRIEIPTWTTRERVVPLDAEPRLHEIAPLGDGGAAAVRVSLRRQDR